MTSPYTGPIETEEHWLSSGSPEAMEAFLGERGSRRRWQLFACHCCWRIVSLLPERCQQVVAVAERQAEGVASAAEVQEAQQEAGEAEVLAWLPGQPANAGWAAMAALRCLRSPRRVFLPAAEAAGSGQESERLAQCQLLRELFGNPFRPVHFDPAWRTPLALSMARLSYEADNFDELPILGDVLEDAGCDDAEVLAHCRGPGRHVRGCWVVDAVLAKE